MHDEMVDFPKFDHILHRKAYNRQPDKLHHNHYGKMYKLFPKQHGAIICSLH